MPRPKPSSVFRPAGNITKVPWAALGKSGGEAASDNVAWSPVTLPHCFNARDAVDPDGITIKGRDGIARAEAGKPLPNGRTLLHFDGAGQKSRCSSIPRRWASIRGGYDQWTVDITDAAAQAMQKRRLSGKSARRRDVRQLARRGEIPSDLSDFNLYGGLYRHVSLVYVPAVSLERMHIESECAGGKPPSKSVRGSITRLPWPTRIELAVEVRDRTVRSYIPRRRSSCLGRARKKSMPLSLANPAAMVAENAVALPLPRNTQVGAR